MIFSLKGNYSIPTDGSGRILITDINLNGYNNGDALVCLSERSISGNADIGDWYIHPTQQSTDEDDRIANLNGPARGGWNSHRLVVYEGDLLVTLRRASATAEEGVFTCDIPEDDNTPRYVGIYYPSESFFM